MLQIYSAISLLPPVIAKFNILPICSLQSHISFSRSNFFCCSCSTVLAFILFSPTYLLIYYSFLVQQDRDFFQAYSQRWRRVLFQIQSSRSSAIYFFSWRFYSQSFKRYLLYLLTWGTRCSRFSWFAVYSRLAYFWGRGGCSGFFFLKSGWRMTEGLMGTVGSMVPYDF